MQLYRHLPIQILLYPVIFYRLLLSYWVAS
jgi:hypothetical protein